MPELIKLNGSAVNAISCFRRELAQPDGSALDEYQIAVMLRGRMTHRSFAALLESGPIRLEFGSGDARETTVTASSVASTGGGESAVYRHDFTLRETPASASRRAAEAEQENARLAAAVAELNVLVADVEDEAEDAAGDTWTTALQKLEASPNGTAPQAEPAPAPAPASSPPAAAAVAAPPPSPTPVDQAPRRDAPPAHPAPPAPAIHPSPPAQPVPPVPPHQAVAPSAPYPAAPPAAPAVEAPLSPAEIAGIEAVLVGLRLEAIIDALDRLEIVPRDEIEQAFVRLVQKRLVAEASLVVGEPVARRAARDILHGLGVGRWALGVGGER